MSLRFIQVVSSICSVFPVFCFFFFFFFQFNFPYLVLAALGLRCCVGAFSSCTMQASHCGGLSCYVAWAPGCMSSVVVAHRLRCPVACRIFPDEGSNPCSLHWQVDLLPLGQVLYQGSPVKSWKFLYQGNPVVCSLLLQVFHCSLWSCNSTLLRIVTL